MELNLKIIAPSIPSGSSSELLIAGVKATTAVDEAAGTVEFTVTYAGDVWIGIGISTVVLSNSYSFFFPYSGLRRRCEKCTQISPPPSNLTFFLTVST